LKFKNAHGSLAPKIEVIESLLSHLVDYETKAIVKMYEQDQVFSLIINYFIESHLPETPQEGQAVLPHSENFKCLDVSLDFLELLLTSLPESLVDKIEDFLKWLIKLKAS
jgi:hypothetical protein